MSLPFLFGHSIAFLPLMPYAPVVLATIRTLETAETSLPIQNKLTHPRSAHIPSLHICASSPQPSVLPASPRSPAAPPSAWPDKPPPAPPSYPDPAPAGLFHPDSDP